MNIVRSTQPIQDQTTALLAIPLFVDAPGEPFENLDRLLGGKAKDLLGKEAGKANHLTVLTPLDTLKAKRILVVGLGKKKDFKAEALRQAAGKAAASAQRFKETELAFVAPGILPAGEESQAIVEGAILGAYRYDRFLTEKKPSLETLIVLGGDEQGLDKGRKIAEATCFTRDLINEPANTLSPEALAQAAQKMAQTYGLSCTVLERKQMEELGMGGLLGVSQGAGTEPKLIVLEYKGATEAPLVLVGKGITFDAGGLCLKPRESMEEMKDDMSGAAAVLGALQAIAALKLPRYVVGIIPACENMPDGKAYRPGDILSISGKTVEVGNTDAEGRLILADALAYAKRYHPAATIDLATLTGACVVALGEHATGMMGNDENLQQKIQKAGEETHERVWPLPLWDEYTEQLDSDIADIKNTGGRWGGAITAGAFLQKWVAGPWVHLDIAGTSRHEKGTPYVPKGITGVGVRLLTKLAEDWK